MASSFLDRYLPEYHFSEVHETLVRASVEETWTALSALRPSDVPLTGFLMMLRRLPARILGQKAPYGDRSDAPILEGITRGGFVKLDEDKGREAIVGIVGQFWRVSPEPVRLSSARDFLEFSRPGFARAVMNFEIEPAGDGRTRVRTETRIQGTDAGARKTFGRYWTIVHPGSALIRRAWLRAVRRRAESKAGEAT
jgi:hypothetical protein